MLRTQNREAGAEPCSVETKLGGLCTMNLQSLRQYEPEEESPLQLPADAQRPVVLLVDDQPEMCEFLETVWGESCTILSSFDGASALEILNHRSVDVIVSDFQMPGMTGIEVLEQAMLVQPEAVRILTTGYSRPDIAIDAVNRGHICFFLSKPFQVEEACLLLRQAVEYGHVVRERSRLVRQLEQLNQELEQRVQQRTAELRRTFPQLLFDRQRRVPSLRVGCTVLNSLIFPVRCVPLWFP